MKELWNRFEHWLKNNAPHLLADLNAGATQADIEELEVVFGGKVPEDFVMFYKIHNGQVGREGLFESEELLSIEQIVNEIIFLREDYEGEFDGERDCEYIDLGVKDFYWNPLWIPFTHDGSGNHVCLDLDPAEGGKVGQVIRYWHDSPYRELYATSIFEWLENFIKGLESREIVYAKGWGLVSKDSPFNQP